MDTQGYLRVLDRVYDLPGHLLGRAEVFVPTPEERLDRIRVTREFLDRVLPRWRELRVVHVGGTSGKGSTAWMLAAVLARRQRTGLVTSPHLFDLRERIRVDLVPISRPDLVRVFEGTVEAACQRMVGEDEAFALRFPEVILATAFAHFIEAGCSWAVVEVALGGRFDQSNVVEPVAAVITNVNYDHMHLLGDTLVDIAHHKAGIIKPGVPVYTSEIEREVLQVFREEAERAGAPLHVVASEAGEGGGPGSGGREWPLRMRGAHQRANAALALAVALDVARLDEKECRDALASTQMPARFQEVRPGVFADVAHNPAKTRALADTMAEELHGRRVVLVMGMTDKKDHRKVMRPLARVADALVLTRSRYRGADPRSLRDAWLGLGTDTPVEVVDRPRPALELARELAGEGGAVVVTGSTFVVDEAFNPEADLLEANALYMTPGEVAGTRGGPRGERSWPE